jgi:hypothetical protein
MKDLLKGIGGLLIGLAFIAALTFLVALFIKCGAWASAVILPFVNLLSWFTISVTILVSLPLSFFKKTKLAQGFLWTYNIWGIVGFLIGGYLHSCPQQQGIVRIICSRRTTR